MSKFISPNFNGRPVWAPVDMLVIHYTGMQSAKAALQHMCDAKTEVSAHYCIEEDGTVHRLVDEDARAWHAGVAWWRGSTDVNGRSIGIELVNPGHEFGYQRFPGPQMAALESLCHGILSRHAIPPANVVGHSDVAPSRKIDPGELFDWQTLSECGIGAWPKDPRPIEMGQSDAAALLSAYGYPTADLTATIKAFQRHFRPQKIDGVFDAHCAGLLLDLLDQE